MIGKLVLVCAAGLAVAGCGPSPTPAATPAPAQTPQMTADVTKAPDTKEVLRYLMRNLDVPLTVHSSCSGVGTTADDLTIGDYLSGFWAEHAQKSGQNWLDVTAVAATTPDGKAAWEARVMLRRKNAEDEMGWGTGFLITAADRTVVRQSFRCLGGG
jgi:hypothetical protein